MITLSFLSRHINTNDNYDLLLKSLLGGTSKIWAGLYNGTTTELAKQSTVSSLSSEVSSLKTSVSEGKSLIASALTDKGISTSASATFQTMADNIAQIESVNPIFDQAVTGLKTGSTCERGNTAWYYRDATLISGNDSFTVLVGTRAAVFNFHTSSNFSGAQSKCALWYNSYGIGPEHFGVSVNSASYDISTNTVTVVISIGFTVDTSYRYQCTSFISTSRIYLDTDGWRANIQGIVTKVTDLNTGSQVTLTPSSLQFIVSARVGYYCNIPVYYNTTELYSYNWTRDPTVKVVVTS